MKSAPPSPRSARRAALLPLIAVLAAASPAAARPPPPTPTAPAPPPVDKKEQAEARAGEALAHFDKGEWQPALDAFGEAEMLVHAPTLVLYMARCNFRLGKMIEARALYEKVVAEALPKDAPEAWVKGHTEAAAELAALRPQIPTLTVTVAVVGGASTGARATIDRADLPLGQPREVNPGQHQLEVVVPGAPPVSRSVSLAPGRSLELAVPVAFPPPPAPPPAAAPPPPPPPRWPTLVAGGAFGIGAAGLVLGAVAGGMTLGRVSALSTACPNSVCPTSLSGEVDGAKSLQALTVAGLVLGGAGVLGGTLLLTLGPRTTTAAPTTALRVGVGSVGLEGSF